MSEADADVLICSTVMTLSNTKQVFLHGEDTDLFVILMDMVKRHPPPNQIIIRDRSSTTNITQVVELLPSSVTSTVLATHSFLGCDTTSAILNLGKVKHLKFIHEDPTTLPLLQKFYDLPARKDEVIRAEEILLPKLLGKDNANTLDEARLQLFVAKQGGSCSQLPPTSDGFAQHSLRVYLQVQAWLGNFLDPCQWGWKLATDGTYIPIAKTLPVAPESILKKFGCSCKGNCSNMQCSCRKSGVVCGWGCQNCSSVDNCANRE